jgi:hypothetical protein
MVKYKFKQINQGDTSPLSTSGWHSSGFNSNTNATVRSPQTYHLPMVSKDTTVKKFRPNLILFTGLWINSTEFCVNSANL